MTLLSPGLSGCCRGSLKRRTRGKSMRIMRKEKGGIREKGMKRCICKGGDGVVGLRLSLMLPKGWSIKVPFMMLLLRLSLMEYLMDLLVMHGFFYYYYFGWLAFSIYGSAFNQGGFLVRALFLVFK